ncbi:MAG: bifunctional glutamate N-acetyltransferase/amino-acid acetyltransferase ArgJ [Pseudomonadota bacterium]
MEKENSCTRFEVPGFQASGISAGIKRNKAKDLALIYSEIPAFAAAVFTQNKVKAAPVLVSIEKAKKHLCQAIIVNSGNANACTGDAGLQDAQLMSRLAAEKLNIDETLVLVASTGVIGKSLPIETISRNIPQLVDGLTTDGILGAAEAIMTTDTHPKIVLKKGIIDNKEVTICGITKGAGMIMPNMATMLAFIMTDAAIEAQTLEKVFKEGIRCSFNSISIDGETSTNDTAIVLANGKAKNSIITEDSQDLELFKNLLVDVLVDLSSMIVKDGEGATKFVEIRVINSKEYNEAIKVAFSVANSNLVKTAFFGEDCNWGRIISAVGASGVNVDPKKINVSFEDIMVVKNGFSTGVQQEEKASKVLRKKKFKVTIDLNSGSSDARVFTTDLSPEYVTINANYRT